MRGLARRHTAGELGQLGSCPLAAMALQDAIRTTRPEGMNVPYSDRGIIQASHVHCPCPRPSYPLSSPSVFTARTPVGSDLVLLFTHRAFATWDVNSVTAESLAVFVRDSLEPRTVAQKAFEKHYSILRLPEDTEPAPGACMHF